MIANRRYYYINSKNRSSGTSSDFNIPFDKSGVEDATDCIVMNITIPKSYYLIDTYNNTLTLITNTGNHSIIMPSGNYTRKSFVSTLIQQLNAASVYIFSVSYPGSTSPDTGLLTFSVTNNSGFQPGFIFTKQLYKQLGFNSNSTIYFTSNTLTSLNVIDLQINTTLYLHCDIIRDHNGNILQEINGSSNSSFSSINFTNNNISMSNKITELSTPIHFYLTDGDNLIIDLHGLDIEFSLMLFNYDETLVNTARMWTLMQLKGQ